ncbi:MAG: MBL fold metallo-hydrolase, partial [Arenicella sp.]|nr:MBL fold metallo-hydrolase [Arenicella sp.]
TQVLIDTGYPRFAESHLLPQLRQQLQTHGASGLDAVVITHAHKNHYGALRLLSEQVSIGRVYFTPPDAVPCRAEIRRSRCDREDVLETLKILESSSEVKSIEAGTVVHADGNSGALLKIIHQAQSIHDPAYQALAEDLQGFTVNDSSAVLRFDYGASSVLFAGDIGPSTGLVLAQDNDINLQADLLAAPHHGVNPLPGEGFFARVAPQAMVVSVSPGVWRTGRGKWLGDYAAENNIAMYRPANATALVTELLPTAFKINAEPFN